MMHLCIYHLDWDGVLSAALIRLGRENQFLSVGVNYGQEEAAKRFALGASRTNAHIWIVDFAFDDATMWQLATSPGGFTWIDHHATRKALAKLMQERGLNVTFSTDEAACVLTWRHLFGDNPLWPAVTLAGIYDVWNADGAEGWTWDQALAFQFWLKQFPLDPAFAANQIVKMTSNDCLSAISVGKAIQTAFTSEWQHQSRYSFPLTVPLQGRTWRLLCLNSPAHTSHAAPNFDPNQHDAILLFHYNGKTWEFSIYDPAKRNPCNEFALAHGGGGHPYAAGWTGPLPEWLQNTVDIKPRET